MLYREGFDFACPIIGCRHTNLPASRDYLLPIHPKHQHPLNRIYFPANNPIKDNHVTKSWVYESPVFKILKQPNLGFPITLKMHFNVFVEGEFSNVRGVFVDQVFPMKIKCCNCGSPHDKTVIISDDSFGRGEAGEKTNLNVTCRTCQRLMTFKVLGLKEAKKHLLPTNYEDEFKEVWITDMEKNRFLVSKIEANGAEVTSIESCILNVVSNEGVLFSNVSFEGKAVAECNSLNRISSITNFTLVVEQVK